MPFIETELWTIEIPDDWEATYEEDIVSIVDPDSVGSLEISTLRKGEGDITDAELKTFAGELLESGCIPELVDVAGLEGLYFSFEEDDLCWREWYLKKESLLFVVSYNVEPENQGMDDVVIDQILDTLTVNEQPLES